MNPDHWASLVCLTLHRKYDDDFDNVLRSIGAFLIAGENSDDVKLKSKNLFVVKEKKNISRDDDNT